MAREMGETGGPRGDDGRAVQWRAMVATGDAPARRFRRSVGLEPSGKARRAILQSTAARAAARRQAYAASNSRPDCRRAKPQCDCYRLCWTSVTRSMRAVAKEFQGSALEPRDRALARLIAATVLRRLGELEAILNSYLEKTAAEATGCAVANPAVRRRAASVSRNAAARCRGPRCRSGATRPACSPLRQARQCAAAARGTRGDRRSTMPRRGGAQRSAMAAAALDASLRRRRGAPHRGGFARRGSARHQRQGCTAGVGGAARRPCLADRFGAARRRRPHRGFARL